MWELISKFNIQNLFILAPSTDFSYAWIVFWFLVWLVAFSFIFDFIAKNQSNKFLKKAMKWRMWQIRWTFPLVWTFLLISRLEWIWFFNMKILLVLYFLVFIWYSIYLACDIKKSYLKRLEKQQKYAR